MPVKNVCECHNPPGGSITCEPHQMAVCGVINGVVRRECLDPPTGAPPGALINWALTQATGVTREPNAPFTATDIRILASGSFFKPNGEVVKCIIPQEIVEAINLMALRDSDGLEVEA